MTIITIGPITGITGARIIGIIAITTMAITGHIAITVITTTITRADIIAGTTTITITTTIDQNVKRPATWLAGSART